MNTVSFTITFHAAHAALVAFVFLGLMLALVWTYVSMTRKHELLSRAVVLRDIYFGTVVCIALYLITLVLALIYAFNIGILQ